MPQIFISYRRDDTAYIASMLRDRLSEQFGSDRIFFDVDNIPLGLDFREHLGQAVGQCDILLAIIGDDWLSSSDEQGSRLEDPSDFVRIEIEAALGRDIPVVPVLVGKATMPGEEALPESIRNLAFRQAAEIRAGQDLQQHIDRLIRGLQEFHDKVLPPKQPPPIATEEVIVEDVEVAVPAKGLTSKDRDRASNHPSAETAKPPIEPDLGQPQVPSPAEKAKTARTKTVSIDVDRKSAASKGDRSSNPKTPKWKTRVAEIPFLPVVIAWAVGFVIAIVVTMSVYVVGMGMGAAPSGDFESTSACFGWFGGCATAIGLTFWLLWGRPRFANSQMIATGVFFLTSSVAMVGLTDDEFKPVLVVLALFKAGIFGGLLIWYWRSSSASVEKASQS